MIVGHLKKDGKVYELSVEDKALESKQVTGNRLVAPVVKKVVFEFEKVGSTLKKATIEFNTEG